MSADSVIGLLLAVAVAAYLLVALLFADRL